MTTGAARTGIGLCLRASRTDQLHRPNQLRVAGRIDVRLRAGFVFLAIVLWGWSRRIAGGSMGEQMDAALVLAALAMATEQRTFRDVMYPSGPGSPPKGLFKGGASLGAVFLCLAVVPMPHA